jgi:GAF domain-containing protein
MSPSEKAFEFNEELVQQVIDPSNLHGSLGILDRVVESISLLMDAAKAISSSLEIERGLSELTRVIVPKLADSWIVHLQTPAREIQCAIAFHVNPALNEKFQAFAQEKADPEDTLGQAFVMRTGKAELMPVVGFKRMDEIVTLGRKIVSPKRISLAKEIGFTSYMAVPILSESGTAIGCIMLFNSSSPHHFNEEDLSLANQVASLLAKLLSNAKAYRNASDDAERLRIERESRLSFVYRQVHDLKTLLTTALLTLELAIRNVENPEKARILTQKAKDTILKARTILVYNEEDLKPSGFSAKAG